MCLFDGWVWLTKFDSFEVCSSVSPKTNVLLVVGHHQFVSSVTAPQALCDIE